MTGLQADDLNPEFLRHFLTETLYLVPADVAAPVSEIPQTSAEPVAAIQPAEMPVAAASSPKPESPKPVPPAPAAPAVPKLPKPEATPAFAIAGQNQKGVVVLVTLSDQEFRKLPELEFLQKILQAIGLLKTDVAYVNNVSGKVAQLEALQQQLEVNYLISFASRFDTNLPHKKFTLYNPVKVGDIPVVFAHALPELEKDVAHKKSFWSALQQVFLA